MEPGPRVLKLAEKKIPKMEVTNAGNNSDRAYPSIRMQIWMIMRCFTNMSPFVYGHRPLGMSVWAVGLHKMTLFQGVESSIEILL